MRKFLNITKALSDEGRVRVLMFLREGELCVCEIVEMLGLAPSTVSKHLAILQQAELIDSRKDGRWIYYRLADAPFDPKPVQRPHPPILIGGMGPKVIQPLVARDADIWHFFVRGPDPAAEARRAIAGMDELCRAQKRDPATLEKAVNLRPEEVAGKPAGEVRAAVQALVDAGVRHFVLSLPAPYDRGALDTWAKEIAPAVRRAAA